jgi:hypothetical protein
MCVVPFFRNMFVVLRGVVADSSGLRVQNSISTINIHEGSHWISEPYSLWGSYSLPNFAEFRHAKDVKTLWINLNLDPSDEPRRPKKDDKWILIIFFNFFSKNHFFNAKKMRLPNLRNKI